MAFFFLTLSMALVGINISLGKAIVEHVPIFLFSEIRFIIASIILIPLIIIRGETKYTLNFNQYRSLFLQGFFGVFLFSLFILFGVKHTSAISAGIITSTTPACIAVLSFILLKEKLNRFNIIAIVLAVSGIALVSFQANNTGEDPSTNLFGNLLVLFAVFSEALFTIFAKKLSNSISPYQMALGVNIVGLIMFFPFSVWELLHFQFQLVPMNTWLLILYYSVTASVLSFVFWYVGIKKVSAAVAGLFTGVMPISAAIVSILFLNEVFHWTHLIGMICVIIGIVIGTRKLSENTPMKTTNHKDSSVNS